MKNLLNYALIVLLTCNTVLLTAQKTNITEDKPVYGVEQMPQFPGGDEALLKFIKDNLKYPMLAAEKGIEGRVTVRFVINGEGAVTDVTVIRGLDSLCDMEAVRVVKMMQTWIPGMQSGKNVSVYYTLPIVYKLNKGKENNVSPLGDKSPLLVVDGRVRPYGLLKDSVQLKPSDINSVTILKDSAAMATWGSKGKNGVILIETKTQAARIDSAIKFDKPLYGVEVMPQFPGGDQELMKFIRENLRYPKEDAERGIEGRTTIRFIVTKTGKVSDVAVIRGLSPTCDAEAIRVVKMMPTWKPGSQKGAPVNVYYTLPFLFKLQR